MTSSKRRQQLIVGLGGSAVLSVLLAGAAVANQRDETTIGPAPKGYCTLSPKPTVYLNEEEYVIDPPDVVFPC